ncbi:MAG: Tic22 family protein [Cyanobacteria bacterium P01_A01_bin.105]
MQTVLHRLGMRPWLALGLVGWLGGSMAPAQALPEAEVVDTLSNIPVFVMATPEGGYITNRLVREAEADQPRQEVALLNVFFSGDDAEEFLRQAQAENQSLADTAVVGWTELSALYQQAQQAADIPLRLLFVPQVEEVAAAVEEDADYAGGVPLFIPKFSADDSYVLLPIGNLNDGEPVVPVFFSQTDINGALEALNEQDPALRSQIEVDVVSLEGLIDQIRNTDDTNLTRLQLLPDSEAINYITESQSDS